MKKIYFSGKFFVTFSLFCFFFSLGANAQIKVDSTGRLKVGLERPNQDRDNVVNLMIFGKNGEYKAGGKLSFGDLGNYANGSWNVFIGEYGTTDTDQLWLQGKSGTYFTYGNSSSVWGYYDVNAGNAFRFNCDVYSSGIKLTSDERLKENISPLNESLSLLQQLNGVSYFLKTPTMRTSIDVQSAGDNSSLSEKEKRDMAFFEKWEKDLQNSKNLRKGFVAQELRKVFPELVSEDKQGMLSVDYIGLIPVIVESIKEQQQIIDAQYEKIKELEKSMEALQGKSVLRSITDESGTTGISELAKQCALTQNAPNPFTIQTEIKYFVANGVKEAYICIFDMQGKMLQKIDVVAGQNSVTIQGSTLPAGIYLYALVADGQEVDTKRMILTK
ncbi:MAG: tail fiber domain-containing protein [Dysgonamonadaceae bacterium]|jgi:hypothetical protein|nr:tail fiber domain-containing protein [Dysgonamonadaceae bacterium]